MGRNNFLASKLCPLVVCLLLLVAAPAITRLAVQINVQVSDEDRSTIQMQVRRLGSKEESERIDAVNQLTRFDRRAIPMVLDALRNPDPLVRYGAVSVLIGMTYLEDVKTILNAFGKEKSINVKLRYIRLFSNIGINEPLVRDALIITLKGDRDERVRAETATALVRFSGAEAEAALLAALSESETEFLKIYLVKALGEKRSEKAVPVLESLLNPEETGVGPLQQVAVSSLGKIGTKEAIRFLIACFDHHRREVSSEACMVLASLKKRSLDDLIAALQDKTKSKLVRSGAAEALGIMEDEKAYFPLKNAAKDEEPDPFVRYKAREAFEKLKKSVTKYIEI